ncbi:MAG: heat-shock protein Hsp20 [Pseudopedobacter saltans]|uniref:Heat-shock protein Hsp20 n=1 Tax=Pseudopedobacter saltans TaxID=151895 RepID=A0A2W5GFN6_9SPHI|nr:MAG: heat-shock protein Hsp20 [Pseudopedobacter saltans]
MSTTVIRKNNFGDLFDELFSTVPNVLSKQNNVPPVNISEDENNYYIQLIAAGLKKEDFKINLEKGLLTISYEKKESEKNPNLKNHRLEYNLLSFKRSFNIDESVDLEKIEAGYNDGILSVNLPKKQEIKVLPKSIEIK